MPKPRKTDAKPRARKKWNRPRIATQKLYERQSLACGKTDISTSSCYRRGQTS